ncbi:MAG: altronate dehydratase family protein [Eubacteriales bacterium]|jgi:altronate hydrolase
MMKVIQISEKDNVAVALTDIESGEKISAGGYSVTAREKISRGHKIALTGIRSGENVIKYGVPIAHASDDIRPGDWVHTHNAKTNLSERSEYIYDHKVYPQSEVKPETFMGYERPDGSVGTRNEIWVIPIVGCVNDVVKTLVRENQDLVKGTIDGLYGFSHPYGCSQLGDDLENTRKVLCALAKHPNAGAVLCVALGCENLTLDLFREGLGEYDPQRIRFLVCQDVEDEQLSGREMLRQLAEYAGQYHRTSQPASKLVVGMKCGGSDGLSGITANPAVGRFSDRLTAQGGTTILTEVPEMFGAENILFSRCRDEEVFKKASKMVTDFKKYFTDHGQVVYENPSPGNKAGGITTLEDKSCGCIQKSGTSQICGVLSYAERVKINGLNLLSGPGNDLVSATDLTAAGATVILFTTGRGTPFGAPAPTVKISTNTELFVRKADWIDFNAGTIADGEETIAEAGARLSDFVMEIASGKKTHSEENGFRDIAIFKDGVVL